MDYTKITYTSRKPNVFGGTDKFRLKCVFNDRSIVNGIGQPVFDWDEIPCQMIIKRRRKKTLEEKKKIKKFYVEDD